MNDMNTPPSTTTKYDQEDNASRNKFRWCLVLCILIYYYVGPFSEQRAVNNDMAHLDKKIRELELYKQDLLQQVKSTRNKVKTIHSKIQTMEADIQTKIQRYHDVLSNLNHNEDETNGENETNNNGGGGGLAENPNHPIRAWNEQEREWIQEMKTLQDHIQEAKYEEIVEKYGLGPHIIEFSVLFPSSSGGPPERDSFWVQLVPPSVMPVSVAYFLDMTHSNLWDGASLLHHREHDSHIIQGRTMDFRTAKSRLHRFEKENLSQLPFAEYNHDHVSSCDHSQYTLGFAGRVGPDFNINLQDNYHLHGPNSQAHQTLSDEADPCFGIVLPGYSRDVIDRIQTSFDGDNDVDDEDDRRNIPSSTTTIKKKTIHVIGILSAKLL